MDFFKGTKGAEVVLATRYEKEFVAHFDQIAIPVAERYQLALVQMNNGCRQLSDGKHNICSIMPKA